MPSWQPYHAPLLRFMDIQTYAIAQLNRRGVIPVYKGGIRFFRNEEENIRDWDDQGNAICVIHAFQAVTGAHFLRASSTFPTGCATKFDS